MLSMQCILRVTGSPQSLLHIPEHLDWTVVIPLGPGTSAVCDPSSCMIVFHPRHGLVRLNFCILVCVIKNLGRLCIFHPKVMKNVKNLSKMYCSVRKHSHCMRHVQLNNPRNVHRLIRYGRDMRGERVAPQMPRNTVESY